MSSKEATIQFITALPDDVNLEPFLEALKKHYLPPQNGGSQPQDWSADELTEEEWRQFVAYSFADELSDPRDDIYTLEHGVSVDASR